MKIGIEKINCYTGRLALDIAELAQARGADADYVKNDLMCESRSVYPPYEDAVTMAVNAAKPLLEGVDLSEIELLIVGTESSVDFGKSVSTWVHRFCKLNNNCRNFEVKQACYGGTAALKMAASWIASEARPGKKALVITSDFSRSHFNDKMEFICGGCAMAMIVSANPRILELDLKRTGYWTDEIADTFRPTSRAEIGNDELSLYSYLDALDGAYSHFEEVVGTPVNYREAYKKHIYHTPFPAMGLQAHSSQITRDESLSKQQIREDFEQKVEPGLTCSKRIGTAYGSSNFLSLISHLNAPDNLGPGDLISIFAYGSGCQGEFYEAVIGPDARELVQAIEIENQLDQRKQISVEDYELLERTRESYIDQSDFAPDLITPEGFYEEQYVGQNLLILKQVANFTREYAWS